jgi:hypothetical protein
MHTLLLIVVIVWAITTIHAQHRRAMAECRRAKATAELCYDISDEFGRMADQLERDGSTGRRHEPTG